MAKERADIAGVLVIQYYLIFETHLNLVKISKVFLFKKK